MQVVLIAEACGCLIGLCSLQEVNPDAPEDQQPEPEVVEERKRFGQCDLSFADVLLTKQSKVEVTCKMMPNEFIHIDHMRAEKVPVLRPSLNLLASNLLLVKQTIMLP